MRGHGVVILGIGLIVSMVCQAYYALWPFLDGLTQQSWFLDVARAVSVLELGAWVLIVVGFLMAVRSGQEPRPPAVSAPTGPPPAQR